MSTDPSVHSTVYVLFFRLYFFAHFIADDSLSLNLTYTTVLFIIRGQGQTRNRCSCPAWLSRFMFSAGQNLILDAREASWLSAHGVITYRRCAIINRVIAHCHPTAQPQKSECDVGLWLLHCHQQTSRPLTINHLGSAPTSPRQTRRALPPSSTAPPKTGERTRAARGPKSPRIYPQDLRSRSRGGSDVSSRGRCSTSCSSSRY